MASGFPDHARRACDARRRPRRATVLAVAVAACLVATANAQPTPTFDPPRGDVRLVVFGDFNGPYGSLEYPAAVAATVRATATG